MGLKVDGVVRLAVVTVREGRLGVAQQRIEVTLVRL